MPNHLKCFQRSSSTQIGMLNKTLMKLIVPPNCFSGLIFMTHGYNMYNHTNNSTLAISTTKIRSRTFPDSTQTTYNCSLNNHPLPPPPLPLWPFPRYTAHNTTPYLSLIANYYMGGCSNDYLQNQRLSHQKSNLKYMKISKWKSIYLFKCSLKIA